jgi:hypothetical protein
MLLCYTGIDSELLYKPLDMCHGIKNKKNDKLKNTHVGLDSGMGGQKRLWEGLDSGYVGAENMCGCLRWYTQGVRAVLAWYVVCGCHR